MNGLLKDWRANENMKDVIFPDTVPTCVMAADLASKLVVLKSRTKYLGDSITVKGGWFIIGVDWRTARPPDYTRKQTRSPIHKSLSLLHGTLRSHRLPQICPQIILPLPSSIGLALITCWPLSPHPSLDEWFKGLLDPPPRSLTHPLTHLLTPAFCLIGWFHHFLLVYLW